MKGAGKPYSAVKLHNLDEHSWGVTDAKGALVRMDGLSMKMTKLQARDYAHQWNSEDDEVAPSDDERSA